MELGAKRRGVEGPGWTVDDDHPGGYPRLWGLDGTHVRVLLVLLVVVVKEAHVD